VVAGGAAGGRADPQRHGRPHPGTDRHAGLTGPEKDPESPARDGKAGGRAPRIFHERSFRVSIRYRQG
jgi:hypothetical protein